MPSSSSAAASSSAVPSAPKVEQVLHVRAKSILSCTFGRSAASTRTGVAPPPSYQTVTVDGVTALLQLSSRDGTVRTVGSVRWLDTPNSDTPIDTSSKDKDKAPKRMAQVSVGEHSSELSDVMRHKSKGVSKDLMLRSDTRAIYLPGLQDSPPLHFQRVAIPSSGFPYTVYTIADMSLPTGPTHAHICVGQLTIKRSSKPRSSLAPPGNLPSILPFFGANRAPKPTPPTDADASGRSTSGVTVRLELRTRDKALIDRIVFSSLLIIAGKHPIEADSRVEHDRPVETEWDAPPTLTDLTTPHLTPNHSGEHLPLGDPVPPAYQGDHSSERHLLAPSTQDLVDSDPFGMAGPGPASIGMAAHAMSVHSSAGSSQSIASAA